MSPSRPRARLFLVAAIGHSALGRRVGTDSKKSFESGASLRPAISHACRVEEWDREDCGYYGVDKRGCEEKGCCWSPSDSGSPWCFHTQTKTGGPKCAVANHKKKECGWMGVKKNGCESLGCCWARTELDNVPWCFEKAPLLKTFSPLSWMPSSTEEPPDTPVYKNRQPQRLPSLAPPPSRAGMPRGHRHTSTASARNWSPRGYAEEAKEQNTFFFWPFPFKRRQDDTSLSATQEPKLSFFGKPTLKASPVVYQISTRPWLYALAQSGVQADCGDDRGTKYVCLGDVPKAEWLRIKKDHADMVWLMGIWQIGSIGLAEGTTHEMMKNHRDGALPDATYEDVIGSPYSVVEYSVNPDIGDDTDLSKVRKKLHSLGMQLMVDFVPNHFARDSELWKEHPEAFIQRPRGDRSPDNWWVHQDGRTVAFGRGPYDGPWTDTLQVNYFSPAAVKLVAKQLMSVAKRADGIRLDMAHLVLNEVFERTWGPVMRAGGFYRPREEFWKMVIRDVKRKYPDTIFLSEAYDYHFTKPPEQEMLVNLGIDYSYNKIVLDKLLRRDVGQLKDYIRSQPQRKLKRMAHFIENHDEPRAALALGGQEQAFAGSVIIGTIPGLRLFYHGQLDGCRNRLGVHLRRGSPEHLDWALHARYSRLLAVLAEPVFHEGTWSFVDTPWEGSAWRLAAWRWEHRGTKRLVVLNFSDEEAWGTVPIRDAQANWGRGETILTDLLTNTEFRRSAEELRSKGLHVGLQPWTAHIFDY